MVAWFEGFKWCHVQFAMVVVPSKFRAIINRETTCDVGETTFFGHSYEFPAEGPRSPVFLGLFRSEELYTEDYTDCGFGFVADWVI